MGFGGGGQGPSYSQLALGQSLAEIGGGISLERVPPAWWSSGTHEFLAAQIETWTPAPANEVHLVASKNQTEKRGLNHSALQDLLLPTKMRHPHNPELLRQMQTTQPEKKRKKKGEKKRKKGNNGGKKREEKNEKKKGRKKHKKQKHNPHRSSCQGTAARIRSPEMPCPGPGSTGAPRNPFQDLGGQKEWIWNPQSGFKKKHKYYFDMKKWFPFTSQRAPSKKGTSHFDLRQHALGVW